MENQLKQTILIVDDEKDFREILVTKLKTLGVNIVEAENGEEALVKLKEIKPDLIMLDVNMPKMNGPETLSQIKANPEWADLKIVFLTNYGEPQQEVAWTDERLAREAGAMDYIRKSDDLDTIIGEVIPLISPSQLDGPENNG
ncbi:MAG: response regulator [Candidatus Yanofskybacteria bacterium CG10_big_fil_rev_8_21_14_0_10_36_16]|uniref:Response regulator n=1 Tax=Candidatus Yanofskybacteria bacterium CG10_big_fil_rev_8_21_14_0_10_36_16 TaxID=1975096 RepID=A0A2J0Q6M4_9BACT|nr:MAG: response regulator [Candidatus Yanofskybacteria bacterium CG10_big_fil_rev_8_21_14_0_10_36_16]